MTNADDVTRPCPMVDDQSECFGLVMKRRCNTRFNDDEANWMESCRACFEQAWKDRNGDWDSYPGGGSPFPEDPPSEEHILSVAQITRLQHTITALTAERDAERTAKDAAVRLWNDAGDDLLKAEAERDGLRDALRELVRVEDIAAALNATFDPIQDPKFAAMMVEYSRCRPFAWSAARAALQPAEGKNGPDSTQLPSAER